MNKLRSDSAFCQLTPQQADTLEGWLFEERLSYPKVVERLKAEFGLETSLTAVRRFYKRLDVERSAQSLIDAAEMSGLAVEALKSGELKPAMLLFANKCLFELLRQSPVPIKEVTTLLRAITSAEAHTMRQTIYEREQAELKERERVRKVEEGWRALKRQVEREEREEREQEAAEKAAKERENSGVVEEKVENVGHLSPAQCLPKAATNQSPEESCALRATWSPRGGEGEESAQRAVNGASAVPIVSASPEPSDSLAPRGTSGERDGERGICISTKDADDACQPSVVEEREYAEKYVTEEAESRLAPLNAA